MNDKVSNKTEALSQLTDVYISNARIIDESATVVLVVENDELLKTNVLGGDRRNNIAKLVAVFLDRIRDYETRDILADTLIRQLIADHYKENN